MGRPADVSRIRLKHETRSPVSTVTMRDRTDETRIDAEETAIFRTTRPESVVHDAFESYRGELFSFLRRATRDESAAEDLLQDAYLKLTKEVEAGRAPDQIRAWLYRVAANLAISRGRRRTTVGTWLRRYGATEAVTGVVESPEAHLLRRERTQHLEAVLATLSADARTALLLAAEGFTGLEIAEAIGRSHG